LVINLTFNALVSTASFAAHAEHDSAAGHAEAAQEEHHKDEGELSHRVGLFEQNGLANSYLESLD